MATACSSSAGAKCDANAKGNPSAAASCAPNRLDPRIQIGTSNPAPGMAYTGLPRLDRLKIAHQLDDILRKGIDVGVEIAPQGACGQLIGARRATDAEIDAAGMERGQRTELLRHHQRRMVRQHDATNADADGGGAGGHMGNHHSGSSARDAGAVVMLGEPVAPVSQALRVTGEVEAVAQRLRRIATFDDGRQIKDRERYHLRRPNHTGCPEICNFRGSIAKRAEKAIGVLTERRWIHAQRQSFTVQGQR